MHHNQVFIIVRKITKISDKWMAKQLQYLNFKIKEVCKSFFLLFHIDWKFDLWLSFNVCVTIIQDAKYDRVFHMIRPIKYDFF